MKRCFTAVGLAIGLSLSVAPAAQAQELWGAVLVGPNGAHGWSTNQWTEQAAEDLAMSYCEHQCTQGFTFYDSCGAIAVGWDEAFWGNGDTQYEAEEEALFACQSEVGGGCAIEVWACTD